MTLPIALARLLAAAALSLAASASLAQAPAAPAPQAPARDVRYVIFHTPGPSWIAGKGMFEQPGIREHVAHYGKLLAAGKLAMGGPHLDERGGGMMIPAAGVSEAELRAFANDDPAVKAGVLRAEVRPWLVGMRQ